jgi:hypothetical protein
MIDARLHSAISGQIAECSVLCRALVNHLPCQQKGVMAENSDWKYSSRRPLVLCFPLRTLVLSSSVNAVESRNRQTASDTQTPRLKGRM